MPAPSRTMLFASVLGAASLAFAGGFAASSATAAPPPAPPIVNVDAWNEPAPAAPIQVATAAPVSSQCNPWEVSDAAMEEILREMQRRGWRQPNQGEAVASLVSLGVEGIGAVDPGAPMTTGGDGTSMITVLTDSEADQLHTQQITLEQLSVDADSVPAPS